MSRLSCAVPSKHSSQVVRGATEAYVQLAAHSVVSQNAEADTTTRRSSVELARCLMLQHITSRTKYNKKIHTKKFTGHKWFGMDHNVLAYSTTICIVIHRKYHRFLQNKYTQISLFLQNKYTQRYRKSVVRHASCPLMRLLHNLIFALTFLSSIFCRPWQGNATNLQTRHAGRDNCILLTSASHLSPSGHLGHRRFGSFRRIMLQYHLKQMIMVQTTLHDLRPHVYWIVLR